MKRAEGDRWGGRERERERHTRSRILALTRLLLLTPMCHTLAREDNPPIHFVASRGLKVSLSLLLLLNLEQDPRPARK